MGDREARRESGRACMHRLDDEVRHPPHLVLDRDPARCIATHHVDAQSRVTDVRREVQRATVAGDGLEVLRERLEVPRDAAERHAASMSSTFSNVRMMRSRSVLRAGASENPQLPATTVVTPWRRDGVSAGSQNTWAS